MRLDHHQIDDQLILPGLMGLAAGGTTIAPGTFFDAPEIDLDFYDHIILFLSGGKDSIACLLRLKELGVDMSRVQAWHHDVDGHEGSQLMDWLFMRDYNRRLAEAFGIPLYFSWLEGGFEGEMLKEDSFSKPHKIETPDGLITLQRDATRAKLGTRLRFPQQAASLQTRWCSSALKIDVARRSINHQERFLGKKTLVISGERREESSNRAKYNQMERHHCDRREGRKARTVDAWRPVLHWSEEQVWDIIERHGVIAPVPYRLGWTRSSCFNCIFNGPRIWATINHYFPDRARTIADYEDRFGMPISRSGRNVIAVASATRPFEITDVEALEQASRVEYTLPVLLKPGSKWAMPAGAFGSEGCGSV